MRRRDGGDKRKQESGKVNATANANANVSDPATSSASSATPRRGSTATGTLRARLVKIESATRAIAVTSELEAQNLIVSEKEHPVVVVAAQPMVEVVAPATLLENYSFPATAGRTFMVKVPKGGVERGQRFMVPLPDEQDCIHPSVVVPVGRWRDGFLDLFSHGIFHPAVWTSCCCTLIAVGQIISRFQLNWEGQLTTSVKESTGAFRRLFRMVFVYWTFRLILFAFTCWLDPTSRVYFDSKAPVGREEDTPNSYYIVCALDDLIWYSWYGFCVYLLINLRSHVRAKYSIPEGTTFPAGYEDCGYSCLCPCFSAAQMLRHTADYDTYPGTLCTRTGLPPNVPTIV